MAKTYSAGGVAHGAKYWRLTIDVKESGGERRRLTKTTKIACAKSSTRGRSAALTALRQWRDELIRQAEAEDSVGSGTPTADYAEDFIARHSEVAPATREEYMRAVRDMRLARIGEVPISMLKPSDVQDWMIWLRDERGLGPASRNKKHGVLAMVCKYAAAIGDAPIVATGLLKAPKDLPKPVNSLTESSALEVAAQLRARLPEPLALAGIIALMTGMRRGEICALRWQNWDEDRQMLLVRHTLAKGENGGFVLRDNPKDPSGRGAFRDIPVPSTLAAALASAREAQRQRIRGFGRWSPSLFICGNPLTGAWLSPNILSSRWSALSAAMNWVGTQGDPVIFHDLRHTFATVSIAQGCDVMSLASILGHKDPSMTMKVYATALAAPKRAAMDRLGDFYG